MNDSALSLPVHSLLIHASSSSSNRCENTSISADVTPQNFESMADSHASRFVEATSMPCLLSDLLSEAIATHTVTPSPLRI